MQTSMLHAALLILVKLGHIPSGALVYAAYEPIAIDTPGIPVHDVQLGDDGYSWARKIAQRLTPASELAQHPGFFAIDAEPVKELRHLGSRYNVWLYNLTYTPPTDPNYNLVVNSEGPFRISVNSFYDRITLQPGAFQPSWVLDHLNGRFLWNFLVLQRGRSLRLDPDIIGSEWIESGAAGIQTIFLVRGIEYSILARGISYREKDWGAEYIEIYLIMAGDPQDVRRLHGQEIPLIDGPWKIKPRNHFDRITLFDYKRVPSWVETRSLVNPSLGGDFEPVMLRDFIVRNHESITPKYVHLMYRASNRYRAYQHTCTETSIHYFLQPISRIKVQVAVQPEITYALRDPDTVAYDDLFEVDPTNKGKYGDTEQSVVSQRLEVYTRGTNRVIAQTEHTDKLDFQFDKPVDRKTEHSISQTLFLLICVLTGKTDGTMSVRVKS